MAGGQLEPGGRRRYSIQRLDERGFWSWIYVYFDQKSEAIDSVKALIGENPRVFYRVIDTEIGHLEVYRAWSCGRHPIGFKTGEGDA
jgi:hypothetical protein